MAQLKDRLGQLYRERFVGRESERTMFREAIQAQPLPFAALYLYGPGGIGKTQLMKMFLTDCREAGARATYLDCRNIEVSTAGFLKALNLAQDADDTSFQSTSYQQGKFRQGKFRQESGSGIPARQVLLLDTYETILSLDAWLRDLFLPQISDETLVVMAGREPASVGWRADIGWQTLCRVHRLRNLSPQESRLYLTHRKIPQDHHQFILDFTGGHPLALALVADVYEQRPDVRLNEEPPPDVVHALLKRFVSDLPSSPHQAALEACALVHELDEPLLERMIGAPDVNVHAQFQWLRDLSFVDTSPGGLLVHDLVREVLVADLRWRNRDRWERLHYRACLHYLQRFQHQAGQGILQLLYDYLYLHRHHSFVRPFFYWNQEESLLTDSAQPDDIPILLEMTERHEGKASAELAAHWLQRQPQNALVFRITAGDSPTQIAGWMMVVQMHLASEESLNTDPATRAALHYLQQLPPLQPDAAVLHFRFWMGQEVYQEVSQIQNMVFIHAIRMYITTPKLAYTFFSCADAEFWTPIFDYAELIRLKEAEFTVEKRTYGVFSHDWRLTSPQAWLALLIQRDLSPEDRLEGIETRHQPTTSMDHAEFETALNNAIKGYARPESLQTNPLLYANVVEHQIGDDASVSGRIKALRKLLRETSEEAFASPRDRKLDRALELAYFNPMPSQEKGAEIMDISFATFRRYIKTGVERLVEILWQKEREAIRNERKMSIF